MSQLGSDNSSPHWLVPHSPGSICSHKCFHCELKLDEFGGPSTDTELTGIPIILLSTLCFSVLDLNPEARTCWTSAFPPSCVLSPLLGTLLFLLEQYRCTSWLVLLGRELSPYFLEDRLWLCVQPKSKSAVFPASPWGSTVQRQWGGDNTHGWAPISLRW